MRHLSIKARLVILHTILMTLVVTLVIGILFSISSSEILSNVQDRLMTRVNESYEYIEYQNGALTFDNDFIEIRDNIYLSAYEPDDTSLLYGKMPRGFDANLTFEEDMIQEIAIDDKTYYVYDMSVPVDNYHTIIVRGIVSLSDAQTEFQNTIRLALILLPLLIVLEVISGYLLSKRAMAPVSKITDTVKEIRESKDLSKRVDLARAGDEIYVLANTFDELLDDIEAGFIREKSFTSDVAHELRTPLATMKMAIEDLLRKDLDKDVTEDIQIIKEKNDLMIKMVNELLTLSRMDQGRMKFEMEVIDLSELTKVTVDEFKDRAKIKGISVGAHIEDGVNIMADELLIIRLYNNILENALKFSKSAIEITLSKDQDMAIIRIEDDGIGIAQDDIERIWDRFYQADTSRNDKGSGLGLSMVKGILKAHEAEYDVKSVVGQGTTFTFRFKLHKKEEH